MGLLRHYSQILAAVASATASAANSSVVVAAVNAGAGEVSAGRVCDSADGVSTIVAYGASVVIYF